MGERPVEAALAVSGVSGVQVEPSGRITGLRKPSNIASPPSSFSSLHTWHDNIVTRLSTNQLLQHRNNPESVYPESDQVLFNVQCTGTGTAIELN